MSRGRIAHGSCRLPAPRSTAIHPFAASNATPQQNWLATRRLMRMSATVRRLLLTSVGQAVRCGRLSPRCQCMANRRLEVSFAVWRARIREPRAGVAKMHRALMRYRECSESLRFRAPCGSRQCLRPCLRSEYLEILQGSRGVREPRVVAGDFLHRELRLSIKRAF